MYRWIIYTACLMLLFASCQEEYQESREDVVVEGWIELGEPPVVLLTKTFSVTTKEEVDEDASVVLPWGKVTVSDGVDTVVLTGGYDERYFPPYRYTTARIEGEPGRTYYLTVEYGNRKLTAQTTIPMPDSLEALRVTPCADADSTYQITAYYNDNPSTEDYYLFLTRIVNRETRDYPSLFGAINDANLGLNNQYVVQPGVHKLTTEEKYKPYFHETDTVQIKFAKIDETTYNIQKAYNEMVALSANPIFASDVSMPTNIQGGFGFWCGYAVTKYEVIIADSVK